MHIYIYKIYTEYVKYAFYDLERGGNRSVLGWQWTCLIVSLHINSTYISLVMRNMQFRVCAYCIFGGHI
jgi:hypothetical protein